MPTEEELKNAHALEVVNKALAIKTYIENSEPDPWYGGLPPLYMQLKNTLGFHISEIQNKFGV